MSSRTRVLGATTVYMTGYDLRQDNITILDFRTEKVVNLRASMRVRLFLDLFNITNSHAAETIRRPASTSSGHPRFWRRASRASGSGSVGNRVRTRFDGSRGSRGSRAPSNCL